MEKTRIELEALLSVMYGYLDRFPFNSKNGRTRILHVSELREDLTKIRKNFDVTGPLYHSSKFHSHTKSLA